MSVLFLAVWSLLYWLACLRHLPPPISPTNLLVTVAAGIACAAICWWAGHANPSLPVNIVSTLGFLLGVIAVIAPPLNWLRRWEEAGGAPRKLPTALAVVLLWQATVWAWRWVQRRDLAAIEAWRRGTGP